MKMTLSTIAMLFLVSGAIHAGALGDEKPAPEGSGKSIRAGYFSWTAAERCKVDCVIAKEVDSGSLLSISFKVCGSNEAKPVDGDSVELGFLGIYTLGDSQSDLVTFWNSATAYRVKIYSYGASKVTKTFDGGGKLMPEIIGNQDLYYVLVTKRIGDQYETEIFKKAPKTSFVKIWKGPLDDRMAHLK